jgi:hypothetical protein
VRVPPHGLDEVAADKAACSKQLLEVTLRNLHFRGDIAGTEMWIREPFPDDAADPCEQSIGMSSGGVCCHRRRQGRRPSEAVSDGDE